MADKATAVSFRYGERSQHEDFRGVKGEITVDINTPTLWVHTGEDEKGTPLAREDLKNVELNSLVDKGVARNDLTNVALSNITEARNRLSALNYLQRDLSDISAAALDMLNEKYASADLANVSAETLVSKLGTDTFAAKDLSNVTTDAIAGKGIAKSNLSNVTATTIKNKGIASNTLDNVNLSDETYTTLDLQRTSKLVDITDENILNDGTYPSAYSVRKELDSIPAVVTNIVVDTREDSETFGQITMTVSKPLTVTPVLKKMGGEILDGTWVLQAAATRTGWVFSPKSIAVAMQILNENWIITIA